MIVLYHRLRFFEILYIYKAAKITINVQYLDLHDETHYYQCNKPKQDKLVPAKGAIARSEYSIQFTLKNVIIRNKKVSNSFVIYL